MMRALLVVLAIGLGLLPGAARAQRGLPSEQSVAEMVANCLSGRVGNHASGPSWVEPLGSSYRVVVPLRDAPDKPPSPQLSRLAWVDLRLVNDPAYRPSDESTTTGSPLLDAMGMADQVYVLHGPVWSYEARHGGNLWLVLSMHTPRCLDGALGRL